MIDPEPAPPEEKPTRSRWIGLALLGMVLLSVIPTVLTWNDSDDPAPKPPTPSPTLVKVPAPGGQPITIVESGHAFVENGDRDAIAFAFVLANHSEFTATNVQVVFTALDDDGEVIPGTTWTERVNRVAGGERTALTGNFDVELALHVTSIADVRATVGAAETWWRDNSDTDARLAAISPTDITVTAGDIDPDSEVHFRLRGDEAILGLEFEVVFRDASWNVVGGCSSRSRAPETVNGNVTMSCFVPSAATGTPEIFVDPNEWAIPRLRPPRGAS